MKQFLLAGIPLLSCLLLGTPARSVVTSTVVSGFSCPASVTTVNVGFDRTLIETQDGNLCVTDPNAAATQAAMLTDLNSMANSLTSLNAAAASVPVTGSANGACKVILAQAGKFYGASGNVNGAATVFILNRASDTGDGAVTGGALLITPLTLAAAGHWSVSTIQPVTASVGVTVCVSSTLYSAGVLTKTNVTSTAATNNVIVGYAQ
jgi:hypothetical protein